MSIDLTLDATITFPAPTANTDPVADAARVLAEREELDTTAPTLVDAIAAMFADILTDPFGGDIETRVSPTADGGHTIVITGHVPGDLLDEEVFELLAAVGVTSNVSTVDEDGRIDTETYGPQR